MKKISKKYICHLIPVYVFTGHSTANYHISVGINKAIVP